MAKRREKRGRKEEQTIAESIVQEALAGDAALESAVSVEKAEVPVADDFIVPVAAETVSVDKAVAITKEALIAKREAKGRRPWSAESRFRMAEKLRQYYKDHPEKRAELKVKIAAGWTPEKKLAHAAKMHEVLNRPEVKERLKEGLKRFHEEYKKVRAEMSDVEQPKA